MTEFAPALIGIAGVAIGGAIQWFAATRSMASTYYLKTADERTAYHARALRAVDRLKIAHQNDIDALIATVKNAVEAKAESDPGAQPAVEHVRTPEELAKIREATEEWREVLMGRYHSAGEYVGPELIRVDLAREALVKLVNSGAIHKAKAYADGPFSAAVVRLKLAVGVAGAQGAWIVTASITHPWNRKMRKAAKKGFEDAVDKLEEIDSETVAEP
ncbi:hypothetical protein [Isoptericola sp. NPDC057191]|uniref:hypothetical protein n=1 Tax=Isoptericola sp. NPDC057191 TaxID=3346041 RepID=UPI00363791FD